MFRKVKRTAVAFLAGCLLWGVASATARADTDIRDTFGAIRLVSLEVQGRTFARASARDGASESDGGVALELVVAAYEWKGARWELVRLGGGFWAEDWNWDFRLTAVELLETIGSDADGVCAAAVVPFVLGDCREDSGLVALRLLLFQFEHEFTSGRYFHRWVEASFQMNFLGDQMSELFLRRRLSARLGASLDYVANTTLPDGSSERLMPRGLVGADFLVRTGSYHVGLEGSVAYRPGLCGLPDALADDFAFEASAQLLYYFLARPLGFDRTLQSVYVHARYAHWARPELADRWAQPGTKNLLELTAGVALSMRGLP